jgi:DNA-binding transcriptional LysR family regulator
VLKHGGHGGKTEYPLDKHYLMTVFVAVAEGHGFAAAARRLGLAPPTVTRAIAAIEQYLGAPLFLRSTRGLRLTPAGMIYLEDAKKILSDMAELASTAAGAHSAARGQLMLTAPVVFGRRYVTPGIVSFLKSHPEMSVFALLADRVVNIMEEGFDVGLRIGDLPDSSLRAISVGKVRRILCASPTYLQRSAPLVQPSDLAAHAIVAAKSVSPNVEWKFFHQQRPVAVRVAPRLWVTENEAAISAAVVGLGVTRVLSYQVDGELRRGTLQRVLPDYEPAPLPIHVVHREGKHGTAKVRGFVDMIVEHLRAQVALRGD